LGKQINFSTTVLKVKVDLLDTSIDMPNQLNQREQSLIIPELKLQDFKTSHMISLWQANLTLPKQIHRFTVGLR
jgi:hypothetical protein